MKVKKRPKAVFRLPYGWWSNTEYHRQTTRIPLPLYEALATEVGRDSELLNINHAIVLAVEDFLKKRRQK